MGASSGNLAATGLAFAGLVVTFILLVAKVPLSTCIALIATFTIACGLAFWGSMRARKEEEAARKAAATISAPSPSVLALDSASVRELAGAIGVAVHPPGIDRRPTLSGTSQSDDEARYWSTRQSMDMFREDAKRIEHVTKGAPSVFDVPSIVIAFRLGDEYLGEDGAPEDHELISFTNVGPVAATNVYLHPINIMGRVIKVPEVHVLLSNGPAVEKEVFGLCAALWKARQKMPKPANGQEPLPIRVKLTLSAGTAAQHEGMQWDYALTETPYRNIAIRRITPGSQQEWTDLDALAVE